ncbi:MAG: HEAT repeat domain-containing protein [Cyanobacteria bacterium P01_A01_bin.114]
MSETPETGSNEQPLPALGSPDLSIHHSSAKVRLAAIAQVAEKALENDDSTELRLLTEALNDSDVDVRVATAQYLGKLQYDGAYYPLVACLKDGDPAMRKAAAQALGALGNPDAIAALEPLERDADMEVQAIVEPVIQQLMTKLSNS